jgi:hypothetical protein
MRQKWISRTLFYLSLYVCTAFTLNTRQRAAIYVAYIFPTDHVEANASDYVFGFWVLTRSGFNLIYLLLSLVLAAPSPAWRITADR